MKFTIRQPLKENMLNLMRNAGYHFQDYEGQTEEKEKMVFVRPSKGFPRFHLFVEFDDGDILFDLHLDQKRPIYEGAIAHSGEYGGEVVEKEAERIKQFIQTSEK